MRALIAAAAVAVLAAVAPAQTGPGEGEKFDIEAALRRVHRLMGEAEKSLVESLDARDGAGTGREVRARIDELLGGGRKKGQEVVDTINEILENLPRRKGGGGGDGSRQPEPGEQQPKPEEGQDVRDRDPRNSRRGEPEGGRRSPEDEDAEDTRTPPPEAAKEKVEVDPAREWLARLPPQVRRDVLNGDFDEVPPKWRPIIEAWFTKMAEIDDD